MGATRDFGARGTRQKQDKGMKHSFLKSVGGIVAVASAEKALGVTTPFEMMLL